MLVLAAVLILVTLGIWLFGLFEVLSTDVGETRYLPKFGWFLVVLLGFVLGAIVWLTLGRRRGFVPAEAGSWPPMSLPARGGDDPGTVDEQEGPLGPDDDPEFLRLLDRRLRGDD